MPAACEARNTKICTSCSTVATILLTIFIFYLLVVLDLFGLDSQARRKSQHYGTRIAAPWYPQDPNQAVVILFNNNYLNSIPKAAWPASFADHTRLLRTLISCKPKIIFYDIVFGARASEEGLTSFLKTIQQAKDSGIQVIVTHSAEQAKQKQSIYNQIISAIAPDETQDKKNITSPIPAFSAQWQGCDFFYPPIQTSSCDDLNRLPDNPNDIPTVAFGLYNLWQKINKNSDPGTASQLPATSRKEAMYVYWGERLPANTSVIDKSLKSISLLLQPRKHTEQPYIKALDAHPFIQQTSGLSTDQKKAFKEKIRNKVIFIGADIDGTDLLMSPVDGKVPGVFYHAMAFDNLVRFGQDYLKDAERKKINFLFIPVSRGDLFEALIILIVWLTSLLITRCLDTTKEKIRSKPPEEFLKYRISICAIYFAVSLAVALAMYAGIFFILYKTITCLKWDFGNFIAIFLSAYILKESALFFIEFILSLMYYLIKTIQFYLTIKHIPIIFKGGENDD